MNAYHDKLGFLIAPLALATTLAACGGGGSSDNSLGASPKATQGRVSVLVADDLTKDYAEVWVTLKKVAAKDADGTSIELFDDNAGKVVNLSTLPNIGTLLKTTTLNAGRYDDIRVTLDNAIQLVSAKGVTTNATFSPDDANYDVRVDGVVNVSSGDTTTVVLDFDLKQFDLDAKTNTVTPVVVYRDDSNTLDGTYADLNGRVERIDSPTEFTFRPDGSDTPIAVTLNNGATVYRDDSQRSLDDVSGLRSADEIEIRGSYDPKTLSVIASRVAVHAEDSRHVGDNRLAEIAGIVQSYNGGSLVIDVKKSEFVPQTATLTIANITNAVFREGDLAKLAASGQWVEVDGTWDGNTFTARYVDLENAQRSSDRDGDRSSSSGDNSLDDRSGSTSSNDSSFDDRSGSTSSNDSSFDDRSGSTSSNDSSFDDRSGSTSSSDSSFDDRSGSTSSSDSSLDDRSGSTSSSDSSLDRDASSASNETSDVAGSSSYSYNDYR